MISELVMLMQFTEKPSDPLPAILRDLNNQNCDF